MPYMNQWRRFPQDQPSRSESVYIQIAGETIEAQYTNFRFGYYGSRGQVQYTKHGELVYWKPQ